MHRSSGPRRFSFNKSRPWRPVHWDTSHIKIPDQCRGPLITRTQGEKQKGWLSLVYYSVFAGQYLPIRLIHAITSARAPGHTNGSPKSDLTVYKVTIQKSSQTNLVNEDSHSLSSDSEKKQPNNVQSNLYLLTQLVKNACTYIAKST